MSQPRSKLEETLYGRYKLVRELGCGGMGIVHLAHDLRARRDVAIKRIHRVDGGFLERFRREYKALAAIRHRGVPAIYDVGDTTKGETYFTMEIVTGETLAEHMRRGPLDPFRAVTLAIELGRVLMAVHEVGIIHRDVKPNNIILEAGDRVRLLDFGVCAMTSDYYRLRPVTVAGQRWQSGDLEFVGNPAYTDPQYFNEGRTSPQNDVFSVCVVLYELVAGRHLYSYDIMRHREILADEFSPALAPLVAELQRGVADTADRHQTMEELVRELEIVRSKIVASPAPLPPAAPPRRSGVGLAAVLAAVAVVSFVLGRSTADTSTSPVVAAAAPASDSSRADVTNPASPAAAVDDAPPFDVDQAAPPHSDVSEPVVDHVAHSVPDAMQSKAHDVAPPAAAPRSTQRPRPRPATSTWDARMRKAEAHVRRCLESAGTALKPLIVTIAAGEAPRVRGAASDSAASRCVREALERFDLEVADGQRQHTLFVDL